MDSQRHDDLGAEILLRAEGLVGEALETLVTDACAHALAIEGELASARRYLEERSTLLDEPEGIDAWRAALDRRRQLEAELASVRGAVDELMDRRSGGVSVRRFTRDQSAPQEPQPGLGSPRRA